MVELLKMVPARYRGWIYGGAAVLALVYSAWQAADHDWVKAILTLLLSTVPTTLASAHLTPDAPPENPSQTE